MTLKKRKMAEKMRENTFDFNDSNGSNIKYKRWTVGSNYKNDSWFRNNPALKNIQIPENKFHIKAIVYSMTPEERENPDILNPSRRRIAAGSADCRSQSHD